MPRPTIFDISGVDLNKVIYDQEAIREVNPHRGHMEHLNGVVYVDEVNARLVGFKDVRHDEFWVEGHIPGRPLLPGVIMVEAGAQLAGFFTRRIMGWKGFVGFGALDNVKFRQQVPPGCRLYLLGMKISDRHHRILCRIQGLVNGASVFEADITGVQF